MAKNACTRASPPPAAAAIARPQTQLPVLSAPQIPQKAPISIIPSRPMFTTPERSENIPPTAANVSGVAKTSIWAIRLAFQTWIKFASLERVASSARPTPMIAAATAPHPTFSAPRVAAKMPQRAARMPTTSGHVSERA